MREKHCRLMGMMMRIMRAHRRVVEGKIQNLGIHPSQHFVLMQLSSQGPVASQSRIAEMMDVSPASVARTLKNLDEGGYIHRADGRTDSRRNEITITPRGETVVNASRRIFEAVDGAIYAGMSDAELQQLEMLMGKMLANLSTLEQSEKEMKQA